MKPLRSLHRVLIALLIIAFFTAVLSQHFHSSDPSAIESQGTAKEMVNSAAADSPSSFVGSAACAACHSAQHHSYLLSAHSRAMSLASPDAEPPDGVYTHHVSHRRYVSERRQDLIWHIEALLPPAGSDEQTADVTDLYLEMPLRYLVGSGRHSRTYLAAADGFLLESPLTWYASTESWSMSPGFDHADHPGFERAADEGCLACHAGQLAAVDGSLNRLLITETAIGCERCHGAGAEHIRDQQALTSNIPRNAGNSIVHPGKLSRTRSEAICAQCHLRGDATVFHKGKSINDFQPGMLLTDVRVDYHLQSDDGSMKVVGHVDQMHASPCYKGSNTITCTTCHDMHATDTPADPVAWFRSKCLQCHSQESCPEASPARPHAAGPDCVKCHMPQVHTDIPHIAFTHHRIGIHNSDGDTTPESSQRHLLHVFDDTAELQGYASQRSLGLAWAEVAAKHSDPQTAASFRNNARQLLTSIVDSPEADAEVLAALARIAWENGKPALALEYSDQAQRETSGSPGARTNALLIAGDSSLQLNNSPKAAAYLEQLVSLRRNSQDWYLLGIARFQAGQQQQGLDALQKAIQIQPFRPEFRQTLADMLRSRGDIAAATRHQQSADRLRNALAPNRQ